MKNFKKVIILSIIIVFAVIYLIYNYVKESEEEIIEEDIYAKTDNNIEETSKIILHITGEVNNPRNYTNRGRSKISRCNRSSRRNNRVCRYK